jgi:hypothetical protein
MLSLSRIIWLLMTGLMNDELERVEKGALSRNVPGTTKGNHEEPSQDSPT